MNDVTVICCFLLGMLNSPIKVRAKDSQIETGNLCDKQGWHKTKSEEKGKINCMKIRSQGKISIKILLLRFLAKNCHITWCCISKQSKVFHIFKI